MLTLPPEEPDAGPWHARPLAQVVAHLLDRAAQRAAGGHHPVSGAGRPLVLAVDGRSASGKSTLAARIVAQTDRAALVHTDDVAWWESFFGWDGLLARGVLEPARRAEPVRFRPPAWDVRDRPGAIEVPAGTELLVVEGVGASRRSLGALTDASVWVQSDVIEARRRGIERDGGDDAAIAFWDEWDRDELPFLASDRPWERADVVACGTPLALGIPYEPARDVLAGRTPGAGDAAGAEPAQS